MKIHPLFDDWCCLISSEDILCCHYRRCTAKNSYIGKYVVLILLQTRHLSCDRRSIFIGDIFYNIFTQQCGRVCTIFNIPLSTDFDLFPTEMLCIMKLISVKLLSNQENKLAASFNFTFHIDVLSLHNSQYNNFMRSHPSQLDIKHTTDNPSNFGVFFSGETMTNFHTKGSLGTFTQ